MRVSTCIAPILQMSLLLAGSLEAQNSVTLSVSSHMDIYRAGGYDDGSDGIAPVAYSFPARAKQTLTFPSVSGAWTCSDGVPEYGADGTTTGPCFQVGGQSFKNPIGPFSGYSVTDVVGAMAGVFLEDALPPSAPPPLRFYVNDSSQGGIQTDFKILSPRIGQVFFIGDGLTGTGAGNAQVFQVPPTATRLYLGYVDNCGSGIGAVPGCYSDNAGSLSAVLELQEYELNWVEPQEPVSPPGRCCMGMAYDRAARSTVMFGGNTNPTVLGDTWTWTLRQGWSQLSPATSPSARVGPAMAYDETAGNILLFGGADSDGAYLNDTWIWDGATWTQQFPPVSPPARQFGAIAYDSATGTVVLFGGLTTAFNPIGDTWTWDGLSKTWTQQFLASSPSARRTMMASDNSARRVVLFGGDNGKNGYYNDTWTWDGTRWIQKFPASAPSARGMSSMAYDRILGSVVLFGGTNGPGGQFNDTWEWNGTSWAQLHPAKAPAGRWVAGMDYDSEAGGLVLFAGYGTHTLDDTWLFGWIPVGP
jgi:hypothetical protein